MARRWGGDIVVFEGDTCPELVASPFAYLDAPFIDGHGVVWETRTVYVKKSKLQLYAILHELGHLFASTVPPDHHRCNELSWLGWEYVIARKLRIVKEWKEGYDDYGMGELADHRNMGDLSEAEFRRAMRTALRIAKKRNIVRGNRVFAIRQRKAAR